MFNELRFKVKGERKEAPPCRPTSTASAPSAAIVPRSGATPRSSLTAHLPVAVVASRNLLDHYLRCHQSPCS